MPDQKKSMFAFLLLFIIALGMGFYFGKQNKSPSLLKEQTSQVKTVQSQSINTNLSSQKDIFSFSGNTEDIIKNEENSDSSQSGQLDLTSSIYSADFFKDNASFFGKLQNICQNNYSNNSEVQYMKVIEEYYDLEEEDISKIADYTGSDYCELGYFSGINMFCSGSNRSLLNILISHLGKRISKEEVITQLNRLITTVEKEKTPLVKLFLDILNGDIQDKDRCTQ